MFHKNNNGRFSATRSLGQFWISAFLLIVATFGSGCGKESKLELGEFAPYVAQFEISAALNGSPLKVEDLKITLGNLSQDSLNQESGLCEITEGQTPLITIDQASWESMDETERESLIFHELGHCVLRRAHLAVIRTNGSPESIMNPTLVAEFDYVHDQNHYHSELFSKTNEF